MSDFLSNKVKGIPPSGIRRFFDLINEMKDAISLSIGEPDFDTPWNIREEGIYSIEQGQTHYSPNAGFKMLINEITDYLSRKFDVHYTTEQTLVTVGGSEAIDLVFRAVLNSGEEVIIPEPSFVAYKPCVTLAGGKPICLPLKEENEFRLTLSELKEKITDKTKAIVLPFPNNPTGAIMEKKDLDPLVEYLKDKDILVISDEIYAELTYGKEHISIASYKEMKEKTVLISGFSKAFAMTGWRLGYVCGPKEIIKAMTKIHQFAIMSAPTNAQYAGIEALRNSNREVLKMKDEYNRRRRALMEGIQEAGLTTFEPLGAFYLFPSIKRTGLTSEEFAEKLLMEHKVAVVPGTAFGSSGEGYVRICYAASIENIFEAIERIKKFTKEYI